MSNIRSSKRQIKWTINTASNEALKYNTRSDFHDGSSGAYYHLSRQRLLDEHCKHMTKRNIKWTEPAIRAEALKYSSRNAFKKGCSGGYQKALKLGIITEVCAHMAFVQSQYTFKELQEVAAQYTTKGMFKDKSYGPYQAACRKGIIDDITSHMYAVPAGFKPLLPATLYYFKIITEDGTDIWKIGITNSSVKERYYPRDLARVTNVQTWNFTLGLQAYDYERTLCKLYKDYKYTGQTPFTDGTLATECFTEDIMQIEIKENT